MLNTAHILETALLLLIAYLVGCVAGYLARRALSQRRRRARAATAVIQYVDQSTVPATPQLVVPPIIDPLPVRPRRTAAQRLAAASRDEEPPPPELPPAVVALAEAARITGTDESAARDAVAESFSRALRAERSVDVEPVRPPTPLAIAMPAAAPAVAPVPEPRTSSPAGRRPATVAGQVAAEATALPLVSPEVADEAAWIADAAAIDEEAHIADLEADDVAEVPQIDEAAHVVPVWDPSELSMEPDEFIVHPDGTIAVVAEPVVEPVQPAEVLLALVETAAAGEPDPAPLQIEAPAAPATPPAPPLNYPPQQDAESDTEAEAMRAIEGTWTPRRTALRRPQLPEGANRITLPTAADADAAMAGARSAVAAASAAALAAVNEGTVGGQPNSQPPPPVALSTAPVITPTPPVGIAAPRGGVADNLAAIQGLPSILVRALHSLGVYHFDQIASWDQSTIAWVEGHFGIKGRITRDHWQDQARALDQAQLPPMREVSR